MFLSIPLKLSWNDRFSIIFALDNPVPLAPLSLIVEGQKQERKYTEFTNTSHALKNFLTYLR